METKAEIMLKRMERLYKNIYNLLEAFQYAATDKTNSNISAELVDENNNIKNVQINSFLQLQQEINRIDNNFKSLVTQPSFVFDSDGTISQYNKTTFLTAEYLEKFSFDGTNCIIDKSSMIEDFVYPTIKLPILINQDIIRTDIYCKVYEITSGWNSIGENPKEYSIQKLYSDGKITYKDYSRTLKLDKQIIKYFGKFTIESINNNSLTPNEFIVTLDKVEYTSREKIGDNIQLQIDDILVSASGMTKYKVKDLNVFTRIVTLVRVGGNEVPTVGVNQLLFNQIIKSNQNVINIPVKPNQKLVIFLSTENQDTISYPSVGIKIDTEEFTVKHDGVTYTIDEYFQKYVTNFTEYLNTLINDSSIPYSLGIRPEKPVLNRNNFRVVQINKHLLDQQTQNNIIELNKRKQLIQNEIDAKQILINQTQTELDSKKFNSIEEKTYRLNYIQNLKIEISTQQANLLSVARDINTNASKYNIKNMKPKYKVIGFWDVQDAIYSPITSPQHIIKYEVQYRYLQKNVDVNEATTYKMISNGKEITVAFSNWIELNTRCLTKVENIEGKLVWETNILDSVDEININQCAISINEGESIEIKIRAISEAGYPISPMKSDWSEPLRIDFPDSLKTSSLQATVIQNDTDLANAEFNAILQNTGVISHLSGTLKEAEKTFYHQAKDIASGQFTQEQKNIPLDECIKNIIQEIKILKSTDTSDNISVEFVDFNGESYIVKNNTTLELFAGNYTDNFDLSDINHFGDIIEKKGYLKIRNNNPIPVELYSLQPGRELVSEKYKYVPVYFDGKLKNNEIISEPLQVAKQILYLRNNDIIGSKIGENIGTYYDLIHIPVEEDKSDSFNIMTDDKYYSIGNGTLSFNGVDIITSATITNLGEIPYIVFDEKILSNLNLTKDEFKSYYLSLFKTVTDKEGNQIYLSKFNPTLKQNIIQKAGCYYDTFDDICFTKYDKYAIGRNTVGAFLYPYLPNIQSILVDGNTTSSSLILGAESEILIPIIFQYRFTDALGNINGSISQNNGNKNQDLTYTKKIGFDILLKNSVFKFDLQVSAKLQSKINSIDMVSVKSNYNNESKENLI